MYNLFYTIKNSNNLFCTIKNSKPGSEKNIDSFVRNIYIKKKHHPVKPALYQPYRHSRFIILSTIKMMHFSYMP